MPGVPAFILRRLYVKGSLANRADGWGFELKNTLGSGYARRLTPLTLDGEEVPLEESFFEMDGEEICFSAVDENNTFGLKMNRSIPIYVRGRPLAPGSHRVGMGFEVPGFGKLTFDFADAVK